MIGAVASFVLVVAFVAYRLGTNVPGTSMSLTKELVATAILALIGVVYVYYLRRIETTAGTAYADVPRIFGSRAATYDTDDEEYFDPVERLPDGGFPREQQIPESHSNPISVKSSAAALKGQQAQIDTSGDQPHLIATDPDAWGECLDPLTARYPIVRQIMQSGHKPVMELMEVAALGKVENKERRNPDNTITKVHRQRLPALVGLLDQPRGLHMLFEPLPGQEKRIWSRNLGKIQTHLGLTTITVDQDRHWMRLELNDKVADLPAGKPRPEPLPVAVEDKNFLSRLGMSAYGEAVINWADSSGMVVGGVPGSGKTASMLPVFAGLAEHAEIHVADGKLGYDLTPLTAICRTFDNDGKYEEGGLYALLKALKHMVDSKARATALMNTFGIANFWDVPKDLREEAGFYPIFVVIDECQFWLDPGRAGMSDESLSACDEIIAIIRTLIQRGRSLGIMVVLTTQKPDGKTIPTIIRDNAGLRIAFRVTTREQGKTILGDQGEGEARPTDIAKEHQGRCVMDVEGQGSNLIQTFYVKPLDIVEWLRDKKPVPDQFERCCGYSLTSAMEAVHNGENPPPPRLVA
jgi:S-DNA-T family DNA segregation ATPase FtsK/SpoIIIE